MANDSYDMLKNISKINLNYLSGTVFDSNIELSLEKIDRIIKKGKDLEELKNKKKVIMLLLAKGQFVD